jgi:LIM domain
MGPPSDGRLSPNGDRNGRFQTGVANTGLGDNNSGQLHPFPRQDYGQPGQGTRPNGLNERGLSRPRDVPQAMEQGGTLNDKALVSTESNKSRGADEHKMRDLENTRVAGVRDRGRPNGGGRSASSTTKQCKKCGEPLLSQFVRALGATYHLDCFKCKVSKVNRAIL